MTAKLSGKLMTRQFGRNASGSECGEVWVNSYHSVLNTTRQELLWPFSNSPGMGYSVYGPVR